MELEIVPFSQEGKEVQMFDKIIYAIGVIAIVKGCLSNRNLSNEQLKIIDEKISNIENKIKENK